MLSTYIVEVKILETGNICHGKLLFIVHLPVMTVLELGPLPSRHCFLSDQWNQPLEGAQAFNQSSMSNVHKKWRIILVMPLLHTQDVKEERLLQSCLSQKTIWDLLWVI